MNELKKRHDHPCKDMMSKSNMAEVEKIQFPHAVEYCALKSKKEALNRIHPIQQINPVTSIQIPLVTERVQAGFPSPAQDYIDKTIDLNQLLVKSPFSTFIVRVNSLSMLGIGIDINDELIVDRSLEAKHRDIVIALIDNDFTVKRLMIEDGIHWLKAENPECSDIYFDEGQELMIWGVVTYALKSLK
ncbi:LexA family transcriptional regulator [Acinetobacter sp. P8-3-8]|uniref:LexA family protein n=1 Tax=Acinetobacter sp. P8-3-8 TaxID=1029823 RepID=UPI00110FDA87|nr:translesion error-prone DNA polymerase V autoproteolytic subunit [Acinetobacter sp. P8-3-8]